MFDNFIANLRKNKGFLTYIPYIPIPEYGQSNAPLIYIQYLASSGKCSICHVMNIELGNSKGSITSFIRYFPIVHNALCLPPKFCINYCCEILLGDLHIPKSILQQ